MTFSDAVFLGALRVKRISLKTEGVNIKSYAINSLLEGYCILNTGLFQAKMLYWLRHVLKIVSKLTKSLHPKLHNLEHFDFYQDSCFINLTMLVMEVLQKLSSIFLLT